jgi:GxxExxY protein
MGNHRATEDAEGSENLLTGRVIGAAIEVHRKLGPGLLEAIYSQCLQLELAKAGLQFASEISVPVQYDGVCLRAHLRLDLLVEETLIVELKAVPEILPLHRAQLLSYLRLTGHPLGLLINFNVDCLVRGVRRVINRPSAASAPSATLWLP